MITFNTVIQRVREVLKEHTGKQKILDRDIASALQLDPKYFAVIKRRGKIPYESLAYFCQKHHISLNWILLEQTPKHLT
jgi:hypothetical protein